MRIWAGICFLLLLRLCTAQEVRFSLQFEDESLPRILELVSASTGYLFSYNSEIAESVGLFTMAKNDVSLDEFMNALLLGTGLEHQVFGNQIIIKTKTLIESIRSPSNFSISGRVVDLATDEPIHGVNVFLSETNLGGVTDLDGYYIIDRVPLGTYEVIFSHISYELKTEIIKQTRSGIRTVNTQMTEQTTLLDTLQIVSRRFIGPEERGEYVDIFEQEFLGRSINASKCELQNPEVLEFIYDPINDKLEVFAMEPIQIVNRHLGYEIFYVFDHFIKVGNVVDFYGKAKFQSLKPESKRDIRIWTRNRKRVYYGSFLHFRRSLVSNTLREDGFRVYQIETEDLGEVNNTKREKVSADFILFRDGDDLELRFTGFLEVIYRKRPDAAYREQFFEASGSGTSQLSLLKLIQDHVVIRNNGRMEYPGVGTYGYWYWERLGDLLPENYDPDELINEL